MPGRDLHPDRRRMRRGHLRSVLRRSVSLRRGENQPNSDKTVSRIRKRRMIPSMARPSDDDSGVRSLQELAPRYTNSSLPRPPEPASPFWSSQMPVAAPPYAQSPPTWSSGQWSAPLQPIAPPHYTPPPIGMGMRRPRRWGLRFMMFFGLVGLGAF